VPRKHEPLFYLYPPPKEDTMVWCMDEMCMGRQCTLDVVSRNPPAPGHDISTKTWLMRSQPVESQGKTLDSQREEWSKDLEAGMDSACSNTELEPRGGDQPGRLEWTKEESNRNKWIWWQRQGLGHVEPWRL
jgi:hypothetical protein